jgi:hypothetical protein
MYFWKLDLLKKQLIARGLTEKQLFYYILVYIALSAICIEMMEYIPQESPNIWVIAGSILNICIPVVGTFLVFRANGGETGIQFPARYFSIGLVASIRFMVLLIPVMAALMIYWFFSYSTENEIPTTGMEVALLGIWYVLLYAYIAKHVRDVAQASALIQA